GILKTLANRLRIVQAGVEIGEVKGKDLIPSHQLSISHALNKNAFPTESLEYDAALNFLRKESVILSPSVQRGYVLLMYQGIPLGFVKNIGNRTNNLYPQSYRIRSTYTPDNILKL
ncbi:MAG: rRNA cytosine-C5-methyltransferase, partial [Bacteroidaceae bacterium]